MRTLVACCLLVVLGASGCGGESSSPTVTQRYNATGGRLKAITWISGRLSNDVQQLNAAFRTSRVTRITARAAILGRDSLRMTRRAGQAGFTVRKLQKDRTGRALHTLLKYVSGGLAHDWQEGKDLTRVAVIAWHDPYLSDPRKLHRLWLYHRAARRQAVLAVRSARMVATLRAKLEASSRG